MPNFLSFLSLPLSDSLIIDSERENFPPSSSVSYKSYSSIIFFPPVIYSFLNIFTLIGDFYGKFLKAFDSLNSLINSYLVF